MVMLFAGFFGWRSYSSYVPSYTASASFTVTVVNPLYAGVKSYNAAAAEQMALTFPSILSTDLLRSKVQEKLGKPSIVLVLSFSNKITIFLPLRSPLSILSWPTTP